MGHDSTGALCSPGSEKMDSLGGLLRKSTLEPEKKGIHTITLPRVSITLKNGVMDLFLKGHGESR